MLYFKVGYGNMQNIDIETIGAENTQEINVHLGGRNVSLPNGFVYGPFMRDYYVVEYCANGSLTVVVDDTPFEISSGDLYVVSPYKKIEKLYTSDKTATIWLGVNGFALKSHLKALDFSDKNIVFRHKLDENCVGHLKKLLNSLETSTVLTVDSRDDVPNPVFLKNAMYTDSFHRESSLRKSALFSLLLADMMQIHGKAKKTAPPQSSSKKYVAQAMKYIETNYHLDISIEGIADSVGINRSYLFTLFKDELGMSVRDYLIRVRMNAACDFLKSSDAAIKTVASSVGYEMFAFSRIFRKVVGMPPTEYRKKYGN